MIYEYKCDDCGSVRQKLVPMSERRVDQACSQCGGIAKFIISASPFHLDGTDPGFPGAYDKWAREHEKAGAKNA